MPTIYDEEKFQKEFERAKPSKGSSRKIARSLTSKQIFFIICAIALWYYIVFMKRSVTRNAGYFFALLIGIAIYLIMMRGEEQDFASIDKVWLFILDQLHDMQYKYNNLPRGSIKLTPIFGMEHVEGELIMWQVRVDIHNPTSDMEYTYVLHISPRPMRFMGMKYMPKGFDGDLPYILYKERKATQWARDLGHIPKSKFR